MDKDQADVVIDSFGGKFLDAELASLLEAARFYRGHSNELASDVEFFKDAYRELMSQFVDGGSG